MNSIKLVLLLLIFCVQKSYSQKDNTSIQKTNFYIQQIEKCFVTYEYDKMGSYVDSALIRTRQKNKTYYKIRSYQLYYWLTKRLYDDVANSSDSLLKILNKNTVDQQDLIRIRYTYVSALSNKNTPDRQTAKKQALLIDQQLSNKSEEVSRIIKLRNKIGIANLYHYEAKYDSVAIYLNAVHQELQKNDFQLWSNYYTSKAILEVAREKYDDALILYKKGVDFIQKNNHPDDYSLIYSYYNIGDLYRVLNQPDSVIFYFDKAKEISSKLNNIPILGYIHTQLGDVYTEQKQFNLAQKELSNAIDIFEKTENYHGLAHCLLNSSLIESKTTNNYKKAIKLALSALENAKKTDDLKLLEYCYKYLTEYNELNGDYKSANSYLKLYEETKSKILGFKVQSNIDSLEVAFNTKLLAKKNEIYKQKNENQLKTIVLLVGGILLLSLITFIVFYIYRKRAKIQQIQAELNESRYQVAKNNEQKLISELKSIQQTLKEKNEINKLLQTNESEIDIQAIKRLLSDENDWMNYMAKVKLLYPMFISKIEQQHSDITNNELRLATLIRFNLSDKEISEILCIAVSSVKKAKNRLKKKLNIDSEKLYNYFLDLEKT